MKEFENPQYFQDSAPMFSNMKKNVGGKRFTLNEKVNCKKTIGFGRLPLD